MTGRDACAILRRRSFLTFDMRVNSYEATRRSSHAIPPPQPCFPDPHLYRGKTEWRCNLMYLLPTQPQKYKRAPPKGYRLPTPSPQAKRSPVALPLNTLPYNCLGAQSLPKRRRNLRRDQTSRTPGPGAVGRPCLLTCKAHLSRVDTAIILMYKDSRAPPLRSFYLVEGNEREGEKGRRGGRKWEEERGREGGRKRKGKGEN